MSDTMQAMGSDSKWIDAKWWRDWLFWLGVAVATAVVIARVATGWSDWWSMPLGWLGLFVFTVAVVGFVRTAIRTYREPEVHRET